MTVQATIVVEYGEGVDSSAFVLAELDDELNLDAAGEVKTAFAPGDTVFFLVQADPALRIDRVLATHGQVVKEDMVSRDRTDQVLFTEAAAASELSAIPHGTVTPAFYGRQGTGFDVDGRQVTVTGGVPCLADIEYSARLQGYRLETPAVELAEDETYTIYVVIYVEAAES